MSPLGRVGFAARFRKSDHGDVGPVNDWPNVSDQALVQIAEFPYLERCPSCIDQSFSKTSFCPSKLCAPEPAPEFNYLMIAIEEPEPQLAFQLATLEKFRSLASAIAAWAQSDMRDRLSHSIIVGQIL
jgi:hypothetical protein